MPYISLDNKVETQFFLLSLQSESKYLIRKEFLTNKIAAQVHSSNFAMFNFPENDDFFWNSVESLDFLIS